MVDAIHYVGPSSSLCDESTKKIIGIKFRSYVSIDFKGQGSKRTSNCSTGFFFMYYPFLA